MSDDYSKVHILLKEAIKLSNNRKYSLKKFTKYRQKVEQYKAKNRNKLLKFADKLYNLFDYKYIKEEIVKYKQILAIAGAYAIDKKDKNLINIDKLYLNDLEKRNESFRMAYETLTDVVKNHPLDQERIDLASDKFLHEAEDISYIAKIKDNLKERVKQAEAYLERCRMTGRQRAAAIIGSVVIGLATYTANINAQEGFAGFGGQKVEAGVQYRGLPDLSDYELVKVKRLDKFKSILGKETILKRYVHKTEGKNKMIATYEFNNERIYLYATKEGKESHFYQDTDGDGNFETESKKNMVDPTKYNKSL